MNNEHKEHNATSDMAAEAERIEAEAKATDTDADAYTHVFKEPFTYEGCTYEQLTFDWSRLTGKDSLAIESEVLMRFKKTVVVPEYTPEYLIGMAARACTERDENGKPVVGTDMLTAMPLPDFKRICGKARNFLLKSGS